MPDGISCLCSLHERSLAALLLDLVALKLLGQKQGFITRLLVAWRGLCLVMLASLWLCLADPTLCHASLVVTAALIATAFVSLVALSYEKQVRCNAGSYPHYSRVRQSVHRDKDATIPHQAGLF